MLVSDNKDRAKDRDGRTEQYQRRDEREAERDPADCPFVPFHHCHL
jgi:hypothetical protein